MEKRFKLYATLAFLVILVASLYYFTDWFSKATGYIVGEDPEIKLAKCLKERNFKLYTAKNCPECDVQRTLFGDAYRFLDYTECTLNPDECQEVNSVPAWKIMGKYYYGKRSLEELRLASGCQ